MTDPDAERFPLLTDAGRAMLKRLREHPHAPRYTMECGNRITADDLVRLQDFERFLRETPTGWPQGAGPGWLDGFLDHAYSQVPAYRRRGPRPDRFEGIATIDRGDLSRAPWDFVPDDAALDGLIVHKTTGTTGQILRVPTHPVVSSGSFPLLKVVLERFGIALTAGPAQVGVVLVGWQRKAFTYPSVTPQWGDAGHLKLNLHPDDWRDPDDRARFLDDLNPEVYTGDPVAFEVLLGLGLSARPKALVSTATTLLPGLRTRLEAAFGCPVVDLYSLNECNAVAVARDGLYELIQPRLYVEILDPAGEPVPDGERGEVTLTGGFNFFWPLIRYRTNDYARLVWRDRRPALADLEGRAPVLFRTPAGEARSGLDVTYALKHMPLAQYTLHQAADGLLTLRYSGAAARPDQLRAALLEVFGPDQALDVVETDLFATPGEKMAQYIAD
jgi:phenylacetate-CoA ligase